jgi:hypothetical protein
MTLQEKLDNIKSNFEKSAPKEALRIMHRVTNDLINSNIMNEVVKTGDKAPEFELKDNNERVIRLKDFLAIGPVVLSFYRGKW